MKKLLSKFIFWIIGWKVVGEREFPDKCLVVSAPHTSNWDFVVGRSFTYIIGIVPKYLIKGELFLPVLGTIIKWNGGIPVYRNSKNNVVDQISELFNSKEKCSLDDFTISFIAEEQDTILRSNFLAFITFIIPIPFITEVPFINAIPSRILIDIGFIFSSSKTFFVNCLSPL